MKKMFLIIALFFAAATLLGVVWENDPSYTPEQQQQARETNERIEQRNRERIAEKERQIEVLAQKYKEAVESAKKRLRGNDEFQKEFAIAAGELGKAFGTVASKAKSRQGLQKNPDYVKEITQLSFDYLIPVIAKYDTEVKQYLDEVNAIKEKYRHPVVG